MKSPQMLDPWLGRLIGDRQRYRLDQRLGGGGMGDVFLATDTLLDQPVALKLLKEKLVAAAGLRKRFEREVALCAVLKSEHIVQVSDYGVTPEGYPFFVMEYLCGQTLGQLLWREKCLSIERTVKIITQVCTGLHLAHKGITLRLNGTNKSEHVKVIHRDLKPDNLFLVPTALGELVKILDFGIAKIWSDQVELTNATTTFLGTYHYAAPEQFDVEQDVDERADIYSLGMILYEMLAGVDPFGFGTIGRNLSGVSWALAHASKPPMPLRQQPGCLDLPAELEAVVMRCLQKVPEQRFASVIELSKALQAAMSGLSFNMLSANASAHSQTSIPSSLLAPTLVAADNQDTAELGDSTTLRIGSLPSTVVSEPEKTPGNFLSRLKSLRLIGAGTSVAVAIAFGIYYSSELSDPQPVPEAQPIKVQPIVKDSFAVANSLTKHSNSIWSVAVSPDGQTLASASLDKTVKLWNLGDGEELRTLSGHTDAVRAVAISPTGQFLASGSVDRTIKIWNLKTGTLLHTLTGHLDPVWSIAISPDGKFLASGSYDGTIKIWHVDTGKLLHTSNHSDSVWSVAISPDGQTLVSGSKDRTIKIWRLQTGKLVRTLSGHSDAVRTVAISQDGQTLVSGSWDQTIKIWNLKTGTLLRTLSGHSNRVISIAISPSGQQLASGSLDRTVQIWNLKTGTDKNGDTTPSRILSGHSDWVTSVAFSPDGQSLISGSKDKTIKIWR